VENLEHLLFGLWSSFLLPFESAQDHIFGNDPSHGDHRAFGIAADHDVVQLLTLGLAGGIHLDIPGGVQLWAKNHIDDIPVGAIGTGIGLVIVCDIVNAFRIALGADIIDVAALEKA